MGAAASMSDDCPGDIRELCVFIEEIKNKIAHDDANRLAAQRSKIMKDHKSIISIVAKKSRPQLQRMAAVYNAPKDEGGIGRSLTSDITKMLGGNYGDFVDKLTRPVSECIFDVIDSAFSKYGSNEMFLADLFCLCTPSELRGVASYFAERHTYDGLTLQQAIADKAIGTLPFWEFMALILSVDRQADRDADEKQAVKVMKQLYKLGLGNDDCKRDVETILCILATLSRRQCSNVDAALQSEYDMTLSKALEITFGGGSCLRALRVWTSSLPDALALCLERLLTSPRDLDQVILSFTLARADKYLLKDAANSLLKNHDVNLGKSLRHQLKGHFQNATVEWLEGAAADGGYEHQVAALLEEYQSPDQILWEETSLSTLRTLLSAQHEALLTHCAATEIDVTAQSTKTCSIKSDDTPDGVSDSPNQHHYEDLRECLEHRLALLDLDQCEVIPAEAFWGLLVGSGAGYREEDVSDMAEWTGWVQDGSVVYREVLAEVTENMLRTMDYNQVDVGLAVSRMWEEYEAESAALWEQYGGDQTSTDSVGGPDLVSYLKDSFEACDVHHKGQLDADEFWLAIGGLLRLGKGDVERLRNEWDLDSDGMVSWDEALQGFTTYLTSKEYGCDDHWIELTDKQSGRAFWYNLRDRSSVWSEQEQDNPGDGETIDSQMCKRRTTSIVKHREKARTIISRRNTSSVEVTSPPVEVQNDDNTDCKEMSNSNL